MAAELNQAILLMFFAPYLIFGSFAAWYLPRAHRRRPAARRERPLPAPLIATGASPEQRAVT